MTAVAGESFTVICPVSGHPIEHIYWQKGNENFLSLSLSFTVSCPSPSPLHHSSLCFLKCACECELINCLVSHCLSVDNQRLPLNHRHKIYPNGTLTVTDVERAADEGKYTCTALGPSVTSSTQSSTLSASKLHPSSDSEINQASSASSFTTASKSASSSFTLSVQVRPVIEPFVFPKSLHQGQRYTILCSVSKGDLPVTIKWYKDGRQISSASGLHPEFGGIGVSAVTSFASNLVFDAIRPEHTGNYTCEARLVLLFTLYKSLSRWFTLCGCSERHYHLHHMLQNVPTFLHFVPLSFALLQAHSKYVVTANGTLRFPSLSLATFSNNLFLFTCGFFLLSHHHFFTIVSLTLRQFNVCPTNGKGFL